MKATRILFSLVSGAAALTISCGNPSPTEDAAASAPRADLLGSPLGGMGLVGCSPLPYDSVTQTIGPAGGTIVVGPHHLTIPAGALSQSVTITAVAPSDTINLLQFKPQGLEFARPALLAMSYANCGLVTHVLPGHIAYTTDALQILELIPGLDLILSQQVEAPIHHFSHYAVAW
jgi:hypothetical protein